MNAAIFLSGLPGEKKEPIENFTFETVEQVKERLIELQKGYCEGEKPRVRMYHTNRPVGEPIKTIEAYCEADYSYVAYLAMKIKTLPTK